MRESVLSPRRDFLRAAGLAGAGLGSVLAGCGATGGAGGEAGRIRVANPSSNNTFAMQKLMERQGYFTEFGVTHGWQNLADGTKILAAVLSGGADMTIASGMGEILAAIHKGAALRVIGASSVLPQLALYSAKPEIRRVEDLVGRSVGAGAPGTQLAQAVMALLLEKNIDPNAVNFVNIGSSADVLRAVSAGKVDAGPSLVDVYETQDKHGIHVVSDIWRDVPRFVYQVMYASRAAISRNRETLVKSLAAFVKLYRFIQRPESRDPYLEAYTSVVDGGTAQGRSLWNFVQKNKPYAVDLTIPSDSMNYMQDFAIRIGSLRERIPDEKFLDFSLAEEAVKLVESAER